MPTLHRPATVSSAIAGQARVPEVPVTDLSELSGRVADVLVVGGGPAGSAAALAALAVRPDATVVVADAAAFPRDKTCGDGIAPHGLDVLRELGVADVTAGYRPVDRMRLRTPGGAEVATPSARATHVIPRLVFDARLLSAARARGALVVRHRMRRFELAQVDGGPAVVVDGGTLAARVVVGADGASSAVRRGLGIGANPPESLAVAVRAYADAPKSDAPPEQYIEMTDEGWPAYAWSFPIGDGRANIGFGMLRSQLASHAGDASGKAVLHGTLARMLPGQPAYPGTARAHHLPMSTWRPRQPDGPVLLAGDAASLVNPLTGEGIYYALLSGSLAGRAAMAAVAAGRPARAGADYRRALAGELGRHLRHTTLLANLAGRNRPLMDAAVRAASRRTELYDTLVELGLGRGTIPAGSLARLAARRVLRPLARPGAAG
ncbi:MAG: geranylgeranyl reductase family protein [Frankia sp.]|nr:geranylgeranyl reductase family protein [Frankia sp.]